MATLFMDKVGGNDANDGSTFANRFKTFATGATAARTAPGDTIRIMASPDETSLGVTGAWTQDSKTVTLSGALTTNISDCETAWTASANVTATATTGDFKEGTKSANLVIAAGFTTGLAAYFATGTLDLSTKKQVSFWIKTSAAVAASTLSLRLCSDTAGVTTVNTIAIPAIPWTFNTGWTCVTVDTGGALGSAIASVALYCDLDPGAVTVNIDNILACKDSTSADSLTLSSLIGKIWNLCWVASATYATNDIRKPTQPMRNGFRYKVTGGGGGAAGATEPTWPQEIGTTVTDGALAWTCEGLEDTWYGIQSINGTTVKLDAHPTTLGNAGRGYSGTTETVATYKREPISAMGGNGVDANLIQEAGTAGSQITYSGGWNRTDMSTQTGETWLDSMNGLGNLVTPKSFVTLNNLNGVRANFGIENIVSSNVIITNCHFNNHATVGIDCIGSQVYGSGTGACANNNGSYGFRYSSWPFPIKRITTNGNGLSGGSTSPDGSSAIVPFVDWHSKNNAQYGWTSASVAPAKFFGLVTRGNGTGGVFASADVILVNSSCTDTTPFAAPTNSKNYYIFSQRHGQVADTHLITTDGGTIISATDQRHTASGISWKFRPTATGRHISYPMRLSVAKIAVAANAVVSVSIWTRRDNANIKGQLLVIGGQIPGINSDVSVACEPSINTWTQYTLTFTPTEAGVVEVTFLVWDGVGITNNYWIDDLGVSQA